ncbi:MAG: response regulator [Candidatus Cloacimonetes bacterium]|nr:response regulator [Candidatus Cloacimonadota bacterium]
MKQLKYKKNSAVKILIVEDNVDTRNNIIEFLLENSIEAIGADSIKEAMQIYSANASDIELFLIDLKLSDGNGMDFLKAIKDESNSSHLSPIPKSIIINHFITEDVRRIGKQLGVIAFIEKPFDLYELMKEVNKTLNPCEGLIPSPFPI